MTAFENIKTNNWPAASNEFEDFLVLKMPLNDSASLTESLPVVAGNQELFPKRTLTNSGVQALQSGDAYYANLISSTTAFDTSSPGSNAFDGSLATYAQQATLSTDNSIYVDFSSNPISYSSSVRIYCYAANGYNITNTYYLNNSSSGTTFVGGGTNFNGAAWITVASGSGTLSHLRLRLQRSGSNSAAGLYAIEVDGTILTDPQGGTKKYYDNNAHFNSNAYMQLAAADSIFDLRTDDFCIEYYFKADNLSSAYKLFQLGVEINWTENIEMQMNTNGTIDYDIYPGGSVATDNYGFTGTQTFTAGSWNHVAFTRQGSTFRGFLNGVADGSTTYAGIISSPTLANNVPSFGCRTNGSVSTIQGPRLVGSIQDFRLYRGTAKYTSDFTPPSAILG